MTFVDHECAAIAAAFSRRNLRARLPDTIAARDPMYRRSGSSYDLKNIREYQSFDDPRSIDWKLFGRTDRAFVKEFYDEADDEVAILVDASASMACVPRDEYLRFVGSTAYLLLALGLGVRLWTFSDSLSKRPVPARSRGGNAAIAAALSAIQFEGRTNTAKAFAQWRSGARQRRVFVFSDFHEPGVVLRAPPGGTLFALRLRMPFSVIAAGATELEVRDPESGALAVVPWSRSDEEAWVRAERVRDARLASSPRSFYRRIDAGVERAPMYWEILEKLYA